jgi:hypothetical protein
LWERGSGFSTDDLVERHVEPHLGVLAVEKAFFEDLIREKLVHQETCRLEVDFNNAKNINSSTNHV